MSRFATPLLVLLAALPLAVSDAGAQAQKPAGDDPATTAFKAWDKDADGTLALPEFRAGWLQMQRAAEVQARLRHQFTVVDADRSGAIESGEYASLALVRNAGAGAPPLSRFDADRSGRLELGEYFRLVQALAPGETTDGTR
jgi:Ca2+-binding EF-hand superfamily protein